MTTRADAHLHLFKPGYAAEFPANCRRVEPDEVTLYAALAEQHGVEYALIVGYEGETWAAGNNDYLAGLVPQHTWIKPLAFVADPARLTRASLEAYRKDRFVGISLYVFDAVTMQAIAGWSDEVLAWLVAHRWIISVNSHDALWIGWQSILQRYPDLCLLVAHLGLPPRIVQAPSQQDARTALAPVLALARFPGVYVKLSGFYALVQPGYDYPCRAAWPYVEALLDTFTAKRLVWGSDFSPSLEWQSFPQTFGLFALMPFLNEADRLDIEGGNLQRLLSDQ